MPTCMWKWLYRMWYYKQSNFPTTESVNGSNTQLHPIDFYIYTFQNARLDLSEQVSMLKKIAWSQGGCCPVTMLISIYMLAITYMHIYFNIWFYYIMRQSWLLTDFNWSWKFVWEDNELVGICNCKWLRNEEDWYIHISKRVCSFRWYRHRGINFNVCNGF